MRVTLLFCLAVLLSAHGVIVEWLDVAMLSYGYIIVFGAIMIESMGVPFPGETALIIGAAYAARTGNLNIYLVVACAASGAIVGDNIGYWIGREGGSKLIKKYGSFVGLTEVRYRQIQVFLKKHGGKAVFFGRFVSVARTWIAVLVGAHHLNWTEFLIWNFLGGIVWAAIFGAAGYFFGQNLPLLESIIKQIGLVFTSLIVVAILAFIYIRKRKRDREALLMFSQDPPKKRKKIAEVVQHRLRKEEDTEAPSKNNPFDKKLDWPED